MIPYAIFTKQGQFIQKGWVVDEDDIPASEDDIIVFESFESVDIYLKDGLVRQTPPSPNAISIFDVETESWVDPRTPDEAWQDIRAERDRRILATDWTQLPDVQEETRVKWKDYRQQLRDITLQPDPLHIEWPEEPV